MAKKTPEQVYRELQKRFPDLFPKRKGMHFNPFVKLDPSQVEYQVGNFKNSRKHMEWLRWMGWALGKGENEWMWKYFEPLERMNFGAPWAPWPQPRRRK